jgi:hypothetical protein
MNYKNAITMTTLSVITVFAIASFAGFEMDAIIAETAPQPTKFMFVEGVSTTALFEFREGSELVPIQQFIQTGGYGTTTLTSGTAKTKSQESSEVTGRSKPSFTLEKVLGGTPYLYEAADQTQKYFANTAFEYPYKFFDVTIFLANGGDVLRSFEYRGCQVTNYIVTTRSDNEEGYTGKGFVLVEQFSFECKGYTPQNPAMTKLNIPEKAKTTSSSDLKSTDTWETPFKQK